MKIRMKFILMALFPMIISGLVIMLTSLKYSKSFLDDEQKTILRIALEGYTDNVYAYKEDDVDITVFNGDTRAESSIAGVVGTKASDIVIEKVINNNEEYFDTNVDVNGTAYYGYYIPTDNGMLFAGKPQTVINANLKKMTLTVAVISAAFIAIFGVIVFIISMHMAKRIQLVSNSIKAIADGNLTEVTGINNKFNGDEIGEIYRATKQMSEELSDIITKTSSISDSVNNQSQELYFTSETTLTAMNEVSKAVEEITEGLQSQSESVQAIAENIGGINEDVESIGASANDISDCSAKLDNSSNIMKHKMADMSVSYEKVNNSIADISEKIQFMNETVDKVKGIVSVIGDISSQTKLLSLNASIEAARAGEAGRGFAVVANSISDLSEDTSYQVGEITTIIGDLVKEFDECINIIEYTVTDGKEQKENISSVINEYEQLSKEIEETSIKVKSIRASIDKVVTEITSISQEIEELSGISENSAASTEEVNASVEEINALMNNVASTAEELSNEAKDLNSKFEFFKI